MSREIKRNTNRQGHYVFHHASKYDYENFFKKESNVREVGLFPPFVLLLRVMITGEDENAVFECTKFLTSQVRQTETEFKGEFIYIKAMKSPVKRIDKKFRYQILMKIKNEKSDVIVPIIYGITEKCKIKGVSIFVEQNPQNLS